MALSYYEIQRARAHAQEQLRIADHATREAAELVEGRLKLANVSNYTLKRLKNELKDYNIQTGKWK